MGKPQKGLRCFVRMVMVSISCPLLWVGIPRDLLYALSPLSARNLEMVLIEPKLIGRSSPKIPVEFIPKIY
jgi:hypothetical protein